MDLLTRAAPLFAPRRTVREAFRRRSGSRWLLATTFTGNRPNDDAPLAGWRPIDLARPPFALGPPLRLLGEGESVEDAAYRDKGLGLWRLGAALSRRPRTTRCEGIRAR